jgi:hypothetical protein
MGKARFGFPEGSIEICGRPGGREPVVLPEVLTRSRSKMDIETKLTRILVTERFFQYCESI